MAHAFVIEYDAQDWSCPIVFDINNGRSLFQGSNKCDFTFKSNRNKHECTYTTKTAYDARVLSRLMAQVSNFQIYCHVYNAFNNYVSTNYYSGLSDMLLSEKRYVESLGDESGCDWIYRYNFNDPEHLKYHENIPFAISEIDTKKYKDFKPYFFFQKYKMYDTYGHPVHIAVILERKNGGKEDKDLFDYRVKFIGSGQPLTNLRPWEHTTLCDDKTLYQNRIDGYKYDHYEDFCELKQAIKELITDSKFKKHFDTYEFETGSYWNKCSPVRAKLYCDRLGRDWRGGIYCNNYLCPYYKGYTHLYDTHDGKKVLDLFTKAFGTKITESVKQGIFNDQFWDMFPDITKPEFVKAFKKFCYAEGINIADKMSCFDESGDIKYRENHLDNIVKHANNWANIPGFDILRFKTRDGNTHTISSLNKQEEYKTKKQPEPIDMPMHLAELKTKLLEKNMERITSPAIYIKSPGKIQITNCADIPYMTEIDKDEYDELVDICVHYKKPKLKSPQEITYRFTNKWMGYDFLDLIRDVHNLQQSKNNNIKWAPAKLFPQDINQKPAAHYLDMFMRLEYKEDMISVLRPDTDYNGMTILNTKKMTPITCDHYEIHNVNYGQGNDMSRNILLFNAKDEVTGIIHARYQSGIDNIISQIIAQNVQKNSK